MENDLYDESFRDHISTVDEHGKRVWVYPKQVNGKFFKWRTWVSWGLLAFLLLGPYIHVNGQPILMLNIFERRFVILFTTFWPQDFWIFGIGMLTFLMFIIVFTVIYGRLFCGWVCPQTIFMEMVFRKVEYLIEGDAGKQKLLNKMPWNREKIVKKVGKQVVFYILSFFIGNTFMAYLIGSDKMLSIITHSPTEHWAGFTAMLAFSFMFYFVFAYLREQVCTTICPYGRMQGVMLDRDTMVIAYDHLRGEPRGKLKKTTEQSPIQIHGDCIDCSLCVHVCPTGIDIRNGTQLECTNCTACIDACDEVMIKVNRPTGLIRYASYNSIVNGTAFKFTNRMLAYTVVLGILLSVLAFAITTRSDIQTTILRTQGMLYQQPSPGIYTNLFNIQVLNKTNKDYPLQLKLVSPASGSLIMVGNPLVLKHQEMVKGSFFIELPDAAIEGQTTKVIIDIYSGTQKMDEVKTSFLGPFKFKN